MIWAMKNRLSSDNQPYGPEALSLLVIGLHILATLSPTTATSDYKSTNGGTQINAGTYSDNLLDEYQDPPSRHWALKRYRGYSMLRTYPQTKEQVKQLREFLSDPVPGIDFWKEPSTLNQSVDIMLSPEARDLFRYTMDTMSLSGRILIPDVGKAMLEGHTRQVRPVMYNQSKPHDFYLKYRSYLQIEKHLYYLQSEYPDLMQIFSIGRSYENRQLYLIKLSAPSNEGSNASLIDNTYDLNGYTLSNQSKAIVWIDAGHHAREWISHASIMFIMETLLKEFRAGDKQIMSMFDKYDFYIMPVVNPDGYQYSHDHDRLWRKTRSRHGGSRCAGVDPNRNYPVEWMKAGASSNPCSEIYAGPKALSEPETKALAGTLLTYKDQIKVYLSLHSYSQLFLVPTGSSRRNPPNYDKMKSLALVAMKGIKSVYGTQYRFGATAVTLYPATGCSDDYARRKAGIEYVYTLELRDKGRYGFQLPARQIKPTAKETYFGIVALVNELIKRNEY